MDIQLTKDTDKILCTLYKTYLDRRKDGLSKDDARFFSPSEELQLQSFSDTTLDDLDDAIRELRKGGLIKCDVLGSFKLETSAIIYMENRFKNGMLEVAEFLSNFI